MLRASLAAQGRAICIFEMIYSQRENASLPLYRRFLKKLALILPSPCKPIFITDAEFRGPWFKAVAQLGWDYVGRLRGDRKCGLEREKFVSLESMRKQAKSAKEPWIIFSSLKQSACQIIKAYRYRMTIEENFRDLKSGRYGLGLEMTYSKQKNRYQVMLILAMLAAVIAYLMGFIAECYHYQHQFQSSSIKNKRVLSRFFLGCEVIYRNLIFPFSAIITAIHSLQQELYESFKI